MNAVLVAALLGAAMTAIAVTIFFLTVCLRPNHRPGAVKVMSRRQGGNGENHEAWIATARQKQVIARYGSTLFRAFYEVEVALTNEAFLAPQLQEEVKPYNDCREAVGLARTWFDAGAGDMLSVLLRLEKTLVSQSKVIQLRNARLVNRINLHLALGGSFDAAPAASQWEPVMHIEEL